MVFAILLRGVDDVHVLSLALTGFYEFGRQVHRSDLRGGGGVVHTALPSKVGRLRKGPVTAWLKERMLQTCRPTHRNPFIPNLHPAAAISRLTTSKPFRLKPFLEALGAPNGRPKPQASFPPPHRLLVFRTACQLDQDLVHGFGFGAG